METFYLVVGGITPNLYYTGKAGNGFVCTNIKNAFAYASKQEADVRVSSKSFTTMGFKVIEVNEETA